MSARWEGEALTDIHCHILPGVDDGAETMEDAVLMARMAWERGVRRVVATPHCNLPGLDNYRSPRLSERFSLLQQAVREAGIGIELLPGAEVLELQGCTLDSVLYYVNQDIPVLFIGDDGEAVLIVGFNDLNTVWMNPENGRVYKVGMNDSKKFFEQNGNNFITYLRSEE